MGEEVAASNKEVEVHGGNTTAEEKVTELLLQQSINLLYIVEGVVQVIVELWNDSQLLGLAVT